MDLEDRHLLDFARKWAPYGGPSADEIFVNFGMSNDRYWQRLREALETNRIEGSEAAVLWRQLR
ncbi:DUF3263 domain-containing protein [Rhodococcus qingshengii]|uniref:DUF3263 domain-containing protein n=1 Tax=Rhodococcus qingshengii TaxID=334542 RepID=UPI0036DE6B14